MHFMISKNFLNPNYQVLIQLVAAFVSQSSCTEDFSLELKTTMVIRWGWPRARAAGPGSCRLNLGVFSRQSIRHLLDVQIQPQVKRSQDTEERALNQSQRPGLGSSPWLPVAQGSCAWHFPPAPWVIEF